MKTLDRKIENVRDKLANAIGLGAASRNANFFKWLFMKFLFKHFFCGAQLISDAFKDGFINMVFSRGIRETNHGTFNSRAIKKRSPIRLNE